MAARCKAIYRLAPLLSALCYPIFGYAADVGISSIGASGGLHTPSAHVLSAGEAAISVANALDPRLGSYERHQNFTLGFGLGGNVELFGRLAEYTNPTNAAIGFPDATGIRDISANVKWQIPFASKSLPKVAVGATDISGGAVFFKSVYGVVGDTTGPFRWSLGYARGTPATGRADSTKVLDGIFGGAELRLLDTRATALAETNGNTNHIGLRYYSEPLSWLGQAQLVSSLQRSMNAKDPLGLASDSTSAQFSLLIPLDGNGAGRSHLLGQTNTAYQALSPEPLALPSDSRWDTLAERLRTAGLDRVRIGLSGKTLVVEFENQRYLHNEVDALGIVFGLAVEHASPDIERVHAVSRKNGLAVLEVTLSAADFRGYLRWADAQQTRDSLEVGALEAGEHITWVSGADTAGNWARITLSPLLNTTVGTEIGLFDYSLALKARGSVPLWRGALAYADVVQRVSNSSNMNDGAPFESSLHRNGVQTVALQQSFWLGPHWFSSVGVGRFQFDKTGAELESRVYLPWNDDILYVGANSSQAWFAGYRWQISTTTWIEPSFNQYIDGARGPAVAFTRWFGDVAVQMFARKDIDYTFVGLKISLPLAPRQGMSTGLLHVAGSPRFDTGLRTLMARDGCNCLLQQSVRPFELSYQSESEQFNSGRTSLAYFRSQLGRMRDAFYLYGRTLLQ